MFASAITGIPNKVPTALYPIAPIPTALDGLLPIGNTNGLLSPSSDPTKYAHLRGCITIKSGLAYLLDVKSLISFANLLTHSAPVGLASVQVVDVIELMFFKPFIVPELSSAFIKALSTAV